MKKIRISKILAIVLILFGLIINIIAGSTYYFSTYNNAQYKGEVESGSCFNYNGTYGSFVFNYTKGTTFFYGFDLKITKSPNNEYDVSEKIFNLSSYFGVGISGFSGGTVTSVQSLHFSCDSSGLIPGIFFPGTKNISNEYFSYHVNNTYYSGPHSFIGCPYQWVTNTTSTGFNSLYLKFNTNYVLDQLISSGGAGYNLTPFTVNFDKNMPPLNGTNQFLSISLINGNTVPPQNWDRWIDIGSTSAFPVNIAAVLSGGILAVIGFRRPRR